MNEAQTTMLFWEEPNPLDESALLLTSAELDEYKAWMEQNQVALIDVCRHFAIVAVGYSEADERWTMSAIVCDMLSKAFPDRIHMVETQGYDLIHRLDSGKEIRKSVKVEMTLFQDFYKKGWRLRKPRPVTLANARSVESAERKRHDFDVLFAVQRGPFNGGRRNGKHIVRFGMVPNGTWLQNRCTINKDSQQQVRITNAEWNHYGFLGPESEIRPAAPTVIREIERDIRRERVDRLIVVANKVMETYDENPIL